MRWIIATAFVVAILAYAGWHAACRYSVPLWGDGLADFHVEVTPVEAPTTIRVAGRIPDAVSVIKDITPVIGPDGVMLLKGRLSFTGFPCATATSIFDMTFEIPPNVREIRLGESRKLLWRRGGDKPQ
jgi:hypothetical protein